MIDWLTTIWNEMCKGNFSFAILVFGILSAFVCTAQLVVMIKNYRRKR